MSEELKKLWEILNNDYGIYTKEKLEEEMRKIELDIGIFTISLKTKQGLIEQIEA